MDRRTGWILYDDCDYPINRAFAEHMVGEARKRDFFLEPVLLSQIVPVMKHNHPACLRNGQPVCPGFVLSRQRNSFISAHLEQMGVWVYNNAAVCDICNDKRKTHRFLQGLPMLNTAFLSGENVLAPLPEALPVIVKPASSHGGDRVFWAGTGQAWHHGASQILPAPMLQQEVASDYGRDLRVYVVFGRPVAAVMRTAKEGFLANYKKGGQVALHALTPAEEALALQVIGRFDAAGAPLYFAGIDFLYHHGQPVVSEVEDVVGSRMLYQVSDIDIASLLWDELARAL